MPGYDADRHHRRSARLPGYDYSRAGAYFVTVCTHERECMLGEVISDEVVLTPAGLAVRQVWQSLPRRFPSVVLDAFVVMPNHIHGVLTIMSPARGGDRRQAPVPIAAEIAVQSAGSASPARSCPSLGQIMRAFKSLSAIQANAALERSGRPFWQRNYHDQVIRTDAALAHIRQYIAQNPRRWAEDPDNPATMLPSSPFP
jgi:putative transposase